MQRLCRYVSRPSVATERMAMTSSGYIRCAFNTSYRDGTTHIVIEPQDFMTRPSCRWARGLPTTFPPPAILLEPWDLPCHEPVDEVLVPTARGPTPLPPSPRRFIDTDKDRCTLH